MVRVIIVSRSLRPFQRYPTCLYRVRVRVLKNGFKMVNQFWWQSGTNNITTTGYPLG